MESNYSSPTPKTNIRWYSVPLDPRFSSVEKLACVQGCPVHWFKIYFMCTNLKEIFISVIFLKVHGLQGFFLSFKYGLQSCCQRWTVTVNKMKRRFAIHYLQVLTLIKKPNDHTKRKIFIIKQKMLQEAHIYLIHTDLLNIFSPVGLHHQQ